VAAGEGHWTDGETNTNKLLSRDGEAIVSRLTTLRPPVPAVAARLTKRPRTTEPFYSSAEWRALVAHLIATRGRRCEDPQCTTPDRRADQRIYGDHIHELKDGGAPLDPANVMLRCAPCHGRKTAQEAAKRMARPKRVASSSAEKTRAVVRDLIPLHPAARIAAPFVSGSSIIEPPDEKRAAAPWMSREKREHRQGGWGLNA
jgi:hypothetical protein